MSLFPFFECELLQLFIVIIIIVIDIVSISVSNISIINKCGEGGSVPHLSYKYSNM